MNNAFFHRAAGHPVVAALFFLLNFQASAQYTNGIYAEFNTSMGSYTCALYYAQSPKAVANFIGLATGQRAWLSLPSGVVKTNPFYAGTTFHRVIAGFMNQGGSPNAQGTDNPGYAFVDEFTNSLRFDSFGVLAMANSGPDSNGGQYFVTVSPQAQLNDVHTIFGRLYGGSNVVYAINHVATDANDKPLTNVVVNTVKIVTNGSAATAFNINAQGLPLVTNLNLKIAKVGTNVSLTYSNRLYAENRIYSSSNLVNWTPNLLGMDNSLPLVISNVQSIASSAQFFRGAQIQYASSTGPPRSWNGKTLTLFYISGVSGTNIITFNSSGGGTYNYAANPQGTILGYTWNQASLPFNGSFVPFYFSALPDHAFSMHWKNSTSGTFSGYYYSPFYPFGASPMSGTFTNSP